MGEGSVDMKGFRNKRNEMESLEQRLRDERPEPSTELFYSVTAQIRRHNPQPARTSLRARVALAVAVSAALVVAAAAVGGISYAATATHHTASAISHVFVPASSHNLQGNTANYSNNGNNNKFNGGNDNKGGNNNNGGNNNGGSGNHRIGDPFGGNPSHIQYIEFKLVCLAVPPKHPFIHITLDLPAVAADILVHLGLATYGAC
jgi:hypothetical protein